MGGLKVRVRTILRIAQTIVRQRDDFFRRLWDPTNGLAPFSRIFAGAIFVNVIANMENQIDIAATGNGLIGVEPTCWEVGARNQRDIQPLTTGCWCCLGTANGGNFRADREAIIIDGARL